MNNRKINAIDVKIIAGDMTQIKADAYVIPQFTSAASYGGVGGAVARNGGANGLHLFGEHVNKSGTQEFGTVLLTESGGGNVKHHLHVVSVASSSEREFDTVNTCIYNALVTAAENGIKSIVAPAMGTGIIGELTDEQSAKSMISAIYDFSNLNPEVEMDISLVIYARDESHPSVQAFANVLKSGSYETASHEVGKREFSLARWVIGIQRDIDANDEAFN